MVNHTMMVPEISVTRSGDFWQSSSQGVRCV